jgi:hypothetical protein
MPDWDGITAHVCASLGWTWDEADEQLDLPRLKSLNAYWEKAPPAHLLIGAYLGVGGSKDEPGEVRPIPPEQSAGTLLDDLLVAGPIPVSHAKPPASPAPSLLDSLMLA